MEDSESGEGGGDVTFATIKFINVDTSTFYEVNGLTGIYNTGQFEILTGIPAVPVQDEAEVTVPLYKGKYVINISSLHDVDVSFFPQVTGGVTIDFENALFVVTGDGTITCKGGFFE